MRILDSYAVHIYIRKTHRIINISRAILIVQTVQTLKGKAALMTSSEKERPFSRISKLFVTLEQQATKFNYVITTDQSGVFLKIATQYDHALKLD